MPTRNTANELTDAQGPQVHLWNIWGDAKPHISADGHCVLAPLSSSDLAVVNFGMFGVRGDRMNGRLYSADDLDQFGVPMQQLTLSTAPPTRMANLGVTFSANSHHALIYDRVPEGNRLRTTGSVWDLTAAAPLGDPIKFGLGPPAVQAVVTHGHLVCVLVYEHPGVLQLMVASTGVVIASEHITLADSFVKAICDPHGRHAVLSTDQAIHVFTLFDNPAIKHLKSLNYTTLHEALQRRRDDLGSAGYIVYHSVNIHDTHISFVAVSNPVVFACCWRTNKDSAPSIVALEDYEATTSSVMNTVFSHDGAILAAEYNALLRVWDARDGKLIAPSMPLPAKSVFSFVQSNSGYYILCFPPDSGPFLWRVGSDSVAFRFADSGALSQLDLHMVRECYGYGETAQTGAAAVPGVPVTRVAQRGRAA